MKKMIIALVTSCLLGSCAAGTDYNQNSHNIVDKTKLPSEIFTYSLDPNRLQPPILIIFTGKFLIKDNCLLFQSGDDLYTPVFPEEVTRYKKGDNNIIIDNKSFEIGKVFDVSVLNPVNMNLNVSNFKFEFDTKGPDSCLMENILPINRSY